MKLEGEIVGFRCWGFDGSNLRAAYRTNAAWRPRVNRARCDQTGAHLWFAPVKTCQCGFQAYYDPDHLGRGTVMGAILAWGKIEFHAYEFRARRAMPILLVDSHWETLTLFAERHRIPLVPQHQLMEEAAKYGQIINAQHPLREVRRGNRRS